MSSDTRGLVPCELGYIQNHFQSHIPAVKIMLILAAIAGVVGCGDKVPQVASEVGSNWGKNDPLVPAKPTLAELTKKAEAGDVLAMVELGKANDLGRDRGKTIQFNYIEVRVDTDPLLDREKAAEWYEKAAKHGNAEALGRLGRLLYKGSGVPKDLAKALERFQSAALQGDAIAQYGLGSMYLAGDGILRDDIKGRDWIVKSAAQTLPDAQNLLGAWYEVGYAGLPKDAAKAVEWWQKAAIQGHAFAQLSLGQAYRDGEGVPKDAVKAVDWLEKSAAQGLTVSQMILGEVYADGNGVLADSVLAYAWMNLASGNGFDVADESRDRVARRMTTFELAEAQRLSSNWKEGQILVREGANKSTAGTTASGNLRKQGNGTIFVVSKAGHAITNQHVTTGCIELRIQGREGVAKLITEDAFNDLALVQIPTPVTDAATVASDPGQLRQGEDVVVFGFPLTSLLSSGGNLTPGVVSALTGLGNNTNQIQITAPIQPGSSGSPVLNKKGEVIGVVSLKLSDLKMVTATGSVGQNVNFAVSGQTLKTFLNTNKVTYSTGGFFSRDKSTADLADEARKWTMVIECWRQ